LSIVKTLDGPRVRVVSPRQTYEKLMKKSDLLRTYREQVIFEKKSYEKLRNEVMLNL